jgi:hypothetical protein
LLDEKVPRRIEMPRKAAKVLTIFTERHLDLLFAAPLAPSCHLRFRTYRSKPLRSGLSVFGLGITSSASKASS